MQRDLGIDSTRVKDISGPVLSTAMFVSPVVHVESDGASRRKARAARAQRESGQVTSPLDESHLGVIENEPER